MELPSVVNDSISTSRYRLSAARVLAAAGEHEAAIDELETYLSLPGRYSMDGITVDPRFDVLLENTRFQTLLARYR